MGKYTMEQYHRKLQRWERRISSDLRDALQKGAELVRREALLKHLSGPKMPRGVGSKTNATLARQSGDLAGSLRAYTKTKAKRLHGYASAGTKYAAVHEYGFRKRGIPERSYLRSSLAAKRKEIEKLLLKAMMTSYRRAG